MSDQILKVKGQQMEAELVGTWRIVSEHVSMILHQESAASRLAFFSQLNAGNEEAPGQSCKMEGARIPESACNRPPADQEHLPWKFTRARERLLLCFGQLVFLPCESFNSQLCQEDFEVKATLSGAMYKTLRGFGSDVRVVVVGWLVGGLLACACDLRFFKSKSEGVPGRCPQSSPEGGGRGRAAGERCGRGARVERARLLGPPSGEASASRALPAQNPEPPAESRRALLALPGPARPVPTPGVPERRPWSAG
uniref:Uncharacterized protein n=2 Tax=Parascaris TaxID=6254 RepID=A0A915CKL3_PARUN